MQKIIEKLLKSARIKGLKITTAESCTGGMVSAAITDVPGSSDVFECGFVTYSNQAKMRMLDVPEKLLNDFGAVSQQVAQAMAEGALANSRADLAVSVTGIAGPQGATQGKPVGLVHFAIAKKCCKTLVFKEVFAGNRHAVRTQATQKALKILQDCFV